jgi:hypothetical protein
VGWRDHEHVEEMPPVLYPVVFMGPLVLILLLAMWWLFASRAPLGQRWLSYLVVAAAGAASAWLSHPTIQGIVFQFFQLPMAVAGSVLTLLLLVWFGRGLAIWAAVAVGMACFGGWMAVRSDGFTGDFQTAFDWRWNRSAEEIYLAERQAAKQPAPEPAKEAPGVAAVKWAGFRGAGRDGVVSGVRLDEDWAAARKFGVTRSSGRRVRGDGRPLYTRSKRDLKLWLLRRPHGC